MEGTTEKAAEPRNLFGVRHRLLLAVHRKERHLMLTAELRNSATRGGGKVEAALRKIVGSRVGIDPCTEPKAEGSRVRAATSINPPTPRPQQCMDFPPTSYNRYWHLPTPMHLHTRTTTRTASVAHDSILTRRRFSLSSRSASRRPHPSSAARTRALAKGSSGRSPPARMAPWAISAKVGMGGVGRDGAEAVAVGLRAASPLATAWESAAESAGEAAAAADEDRKLAGLSSPVGDASGAVDDAAAVAGAVEGPALSTEYPPRAFSVWLMESVVGVPSAVVKAYAPEPLPPPLPPPTDPAAERALAKSSLPKA